MISTAFSRISIGVAALTGLLAFCAVGQARDYLKGERPQQRGYSEAVITEGGKMVWLAGQIATVDDAGKSLAGDFDGQVRQIFKNLDRTLQKTGGKLGDMVQMTVFITDVRYGDRLTQIRREVFRDNFPGSALITISALAVPEAKIEIQGYAVVGGK
jgi:enamine deaminase RidA (YjgF/YER057c/UK114 family)